MGASVGDDGVKRDDTVRIFSEAMPAGANVARLNAIGAENDSPSRELARFTKETGDAYPTGLHGELVFRADRFLRGGDHESFNEAGFAALRFTEPRETFAHQHQDVRVENGVQYGDLLQYVDFDYLAKVTRYNAAALAALALAPAPPKASVDTKALDQRHDAALGRRPARGALRGRAPRQHRADLDQRAGRRQRHPRDAAVLQGQLAVRRAQRRRARPPLAGGLPDPGALSAAVRPARRSRGRARRRAR